MREGLLFAVSLENIGRVERWLAVVGGGLLGALLTGVLSALLARALFLGRMPRLARVTISLLGGVAAGWLVFLLLFGGGGPGMGGNGGWNAGGSGTNTGTPEGTSAPPKNGTESSGQPTDKGILRVEILGNKPLEKIAGSRFDEERCYRIAGSKGPELLITLTDLKKRIEERLRQSPPLRVVEIVLYSDSPGTVTADYRDLANWARQLRPEGQEKLKVETVTRDREAPVP